MQGIQGCHTVREDHRKRSEFRAGGLPRLPKCENQVFRLFQGILGLLHAQGYTYVVYDAGAMNWLEYVYQNQVLLADTPQYLAFQQTYLVPVASWGNFSLFRVP